MNWDYQEVKLKGLASEYIDCVWWENYSDVNAQSFKHLLIPDNTIELIFTKAEIKREFPSIQDGNSRKSQLSGLRTIPQICTVYESPALGIRFRPQKFYRLCQVDIYKTINNSLDPVACFGSPISRLETELFNLTSQQERINLVESFFNSYIESELRENDTIFEKIISHMELCNGNCTIKEFPVLFNTSASTIERKFKRNLGLSPKKYANLIRFVNQFLSRKETFESFGENTGFNFYDQSHFIKEFSKFSGLTPKQLAKLNLGIQEAFFRK